MEKKTTWNNFIIKNHYAIVIFYLVYLGNSSLFRNQDSRNISLISFSFFCIFNFPYLLVFIVKLVLKHYKYMSSMDCEGSLFNNILCFIEFYFLVLIIFLTIFHNFSCGLWTWWIQHFLSLNVSSQLIHPLEQGQVK